MTHPLEIHPLFDRDVYEHAAWLEERTPGMGGEFIDAVNAALDDLAEGPQRHQELFAPYRRVLILRFQVLIPFRILEDRLRVIGLVHGARDIPRWMAWRIADA